jgi:hypothetical protein
MRYIIETRDEEGLIGIQISKWAKENKLEIIEKADPLVEMKVHLERIARALDVLKKSGYNSEVMRMWLSKKTGLGFNKIDALLKSQIEFFKVIGVKI